MTIDAAQIEAVIRKVLAQIPAEDALNTEY